MKFSHKQENDIPVQARQLVGPPARPGVVGAGPDALRGESAGAGRPWTPDTGLMVFKINY